MAQLLENFSRSKIDLSVLSSCRPTRTQANWSTTLEVLDWTCRLLASRPRIGADNPLGIALLSLFRAAAHPADRFGIGHMRLTPWPFLPADENELHRHSGGAA